MAPDESGVSLRDFMEVRFRAIERELGDLRSAIEKMAVDTAGFNRTILQVNTLCERLSDAETRIDGVEHGMQRNSSQLVVVRYVGGVLATVLVALAIAWMKALLGL